MAQFCCFSLVQKRASGSCTFAERLAAALARRNIHYGWVMAGVTFLTMLIGAGAVGAPGVLLLPLRREFGRDTASISGAMAVRFLLFGPMAPFAAALINRFGLRRMALLSLALVAGGLVTSLAMTEAWQLLLLWGVVVGFGTGLTALVMGATVATRGFSARRGLVVGLLTASSATGQLVFMPLLAVFAEDVGWRSAIALPAGLLGVAALGVLAPMRDRPADLSRTLPAGYLPAFLAAGALCTVAALMITTIGRAAPRPAVAL